VLNDRHGQYAGSLVIHGQLTPVRLDGIHLNQAGSVVLADAIAKYVGPMLGTKVPS
jgi:lysophospholipase L1-like esterase